MREPQLPPEARELLADVRGLEAHLRSLREEFNFDLERVQKAFALAQKEYKRMSRDLDERRELVEALVHDKTTAFEFVGRAYADYEEARAQRESELLRAKPHAARKAAEVVKAKGRELAEARRRMKVAEWVVVLYELHFPWLDELRDLDEEASYIAGADGTGMNGDTEIDGFVTDEATGGSGADIDPTRRWLTADEYQGLSSVERNQRALDRYLRSRKTPWQLGRDYERYVGYLREQAGCKVTYQGIFKGLEDLGRDVIAERNGEIEVIQCKRWARAKTIHEKHVFQLFGTVVAMRIEHPFEHVRGTFTTTTTLSERAREFARVLEITVEEGLPLADYPRIKCNIAQPSGEHIYHLPLDQQYDTTVIEPERGERYVATVAEAEELGFRRAWRWRPSESGP
jgi:hypothetical protein